MTIIEGTVVILDLDRFSELTKSMGWDEYKPNIITGTLTHLVEDFVRKYSADILYGLDHKRGTEEAVIEIPYVKPEEIIDDLKRIKAEIEKLGASISIGVAYGPLEPVKVRCRRDAYSGITRRKALKALREAKRKGGNKIVIFGLGVVG